MAVAVYTKERCPICEGPFNPEKGLRCNDHRKRRPNSCYIQVTGVRGYPSRRVRIYSDKEGNPLFVKTVYAVKEQIIFEIRRGVFDPRLYLPEHRDRLLWKNYVIHYTQELERRNERKKGSTDWLSNSSLREYKTYQRLYLTPFFGDIAISDIRLADIKRFLREIKGVSSGEEATDLVKAKCLDGIRHFLNFAVGEEEIAPPSFKVPSFKKEREKPLQTMTFEEQEALLAKVEPDHKIFFDFLRRTGRRENEARALKIRDISFSKKEYTVNDAFDEEEEKSFPKVKATAGAVLPMVGELADLLRKAIAGRTALDDYVFLNPTTKRGYKAVTLNTIFRRARKAAGFLTITTNEFGRHSWATQRLNEGWSFDQVAIFLLNSPEVVRKRYANVTRATRTAILQLHARSGKSSSGGKRGAKKEGSVTA